MNYSEIIRAIRVESLLSQKDFSKAIGVSFATVNRWENAKATPNFKTMQKIDVFCREHNLNYDIRRAMEDTDE